MPEYQIHLEDKFGSLQLIDVVAEAAAVTEQWVNQTLTTVNDSLVRLGVVEGEFHWHKHDARTSSSTSSRATSRSRSRAASRSARAGQGVTIPRGVMHRPIAHKRTAMLMVEPATV